MPPSLEQLRAASAAAPHDLAALKNLAHALLQSGYLLEARGIAARVLAANPGNLGFAAVEFGAATLLGDTEAIYRGYQLSARLVPDHLDVLSQRAEAANRSALPTPGELFQIHADYGRALERVRPGPGLATVHDPDPGRRLRVGLVSYDFRRDSSVPFFINPLFDHLDRTQFEIFVYQLGSITDEGTERFRARSDAWRHLQGATDDALAAQIIADRIDIALEIHGHTGIRRILPAFQPRCAPVQVSYVGYSNTTGVRSMDWRIVDSLTDPGPGAEALATERLYRLDPCFLCYTPHPDTPEPSPAPALADRRITFGAFSELLKLNEATLRLWSRVVSAVPGSRLLLKNRAGDRPDAATFLRSRLQSAGLEGGRIEILPRTEAFLDHLRAYRHLDIALDTFPYNGTTTVCESLLMGVPMITLHPLARHDRHSARVALSLITGAGLPELVAHDEDDFVRIATNLAADPARLDGFRRRVRDSFVASPVCDAPAFACRFGDALRFMWKDRCARSTPG